MIGTILTALFSSSKVQDTAVDALRKLGNLDEMTMQEKAAFLNEMMVNTKHQSPTRRFIALVLSLLFFLLITTWLVAAGVGYYFNLTVSLEFAGAVKMFLADVVQQPFSIILSFYFVLNIVQKVGK